MAFFEDLGKKITQTGQGVVQKTKDTAEVLRINGMISDEEKALNNLFIEIGKKYFELHSDSFEPQFEQMIIGIKETKTKIANYSEQVKKLKGIVSCPKCGGDVPYGASFCSTCGYKMTVQTAVNNSVADNAARHCLKCGAILGDNVAFCTNCGTKVETVEAVESTPTVQEPQQKVCPKCNNPIGEGTVFCTECGTKLVD